MKKVVLSLAIVAMMSVSFVSCKETKTEENTEVSADTTVVTPEVAPEVTTDTVAVSTDTVAMPATEAAH